MERLKRAAAIHDISGFGKCSLTVALPIISAMGIEVSVIPTAVLSTHTGGFTGFTYRDLTGDMRPIAEHWRSEHLHFDAFYTGYIASREQVQQVCDFYDCIRSDDTLLFVDPAMADHGRLYTGFGPDFPAAMAQIVARADVAAPNLTEACLLTGTEYREDYDEDYIRALLLRLTELGAKQAVLTGVSFDPSQVGVMGYDGADRKSVV